MSGIAGIFNLDGEPVDRQLLMDIAGSMSYRGPDASNLWVDGPIGFGHALLRTTIEAENEQQPCSLDGYTWITADARLDGREELIKKLKASGQNALEKACDAELILQAYQTWGNDLVYHLLGDFAFAVWDAKRRSLFCARDHFGVKPFYFASVGTSFVFSNTLNSIRCHPQVSNRLNKEAIADFLLCGYNPNPESTALADIQRLPPGHTLRVTADTAPQRSRYWELPVESLLRYKRPDDYIEQFLGLFHQAVADRLRTRSVSVLMSGGMDSTSVAATAFRILSQESAQFDLKAFTLTREHLFKDEERLYSQAVASALGFQVHHIAEYEEPVLGKLTSYQPDTPEPCEACQPAQYQNRLQSIAPHSRSGLTGEGGDPALDPALPISNLKGLLKGLVFDRIAFDIGRYYRSYGHFPRLDIRSTLKRSREFSKKNPGPGYPPWLNQELAMHFDLPGRWKIRNQEHRSIDSSRSRAYWNLKNPYWTNVFENYDPGVTHFPIELRHPFFDIRLVAFMLALPPVPWCVDKHILRKAMAGILPDFVLQRPKTPLLSSPVYERLRKSPFPDLDDLASTPGLTQFIDINRFLKIAKNPNKIRPEEITLVTRPLGLAVWLRRLNNFPAKLKMEQAHGIN